MHILGTTACIRLSSDKLHGIVLGQGPKQQNKVSEMPLNTTLSQTPGRIQGLQLSCSVTWPLKAENYVLRIGLH